MNLIVLDNVLVDPSSYVRDALSYGFEEIFDADKVFKGIQQRSDECRSIRKTIYQSN